MNSEQAPLNYREDLQRGKIHRGNFAANQVFLTQHVNLLRGRRVLEIGCGAGHLTEWLLDQGIDATGIDLSSDLINHAHGGKWRNHFKLMDGQKLEFADASFDVVLSFDVLEHLPNVKQHLESVRRVLTERGYYLLQTPNKFTNAPYEILRHKSLTHYKTFHCSLQTAGSLKRLLIGYGFLAQFIKVDIRTPFFRQKLSNSFGPLGWPLQHVPYHKLPLFMVPNFYVVAQKTE